MTRTRLLSTSLPFLFLLAAGCGGARAPAAAAPSPRDARDSSPAEPVGLAVSADPAREAEASAAAPADSPPPPPPSPEPSPDRAALRADSAVSAGPAGAAVHNPVAPFPAAVAKDAPRPARHEGRPMSAPLPPPLTVAAPPVSAPFAGVKAGEWDDNANYREFNKWIAAEQAQPFHRVDVRDRQFLVVRDTSGKPVPNCAVAVADAQGRKVTLTTTSTGRAILFPHAEGLAGDSLTASTTCQNGTATARVSVAQGDGVVDLKLAVKRVLPAVLDVDVAFILDTTGSMAEEITAVKATIQKVAGALSSGNVRVRIGLVEYKDRTDPFVTKVYPMSTDLRRFQGQVAAISAGGGGDTPEDVNAGLHAGLTGLEWSGTAVAKLAFLIGDAPPHLDYPDGADYAVDMRNAAHRGIQVFTVAASGMDDLGQVVWRQIAQYTGASNLFVLRGGAGPQSTGAGDPKSSCGGTQTAYASGNLDALILQKVQRAVAGLERDPLRIAGLHTDENAKPCAERLVMAE